MRSGEIKKIIKKKQKEEHFSIYCQFNEITLRENFGRRFLPNY